MNAQEAILKIKALFDDNVASLEAAAPMVAPVIEEIKMAEYSLMDGTKVEISALEVGGEVKMADGSPAPQGEHILADGTRIQVDEAGKIIEIASPKEDLVPEEAPVAVVEASAPIAAIANLEAQLAEANEKIVGLEVKVKAGFAQVAELIEALSIQPTADPIQKANNFSAYVNTADMKFDRLEKYRNAILKTK